MIFSALRLAQRDHAVGIVGRTEFVLHLFDQDFDRVADFGLLFVGAPFVQADRAFALEADIDQCPFVVDFDNPTVDDLSLGIVLLFLPEPFQKPLLGFFFGRQDREFVGDVVVFEVSDEVTVDHVWCSSVELSQFDRRPNRWKARGG